MKTKTMLKQFEAWCAIGLAALLLVLAPAGLSHAQVATMKGLEYKPLTLKLDEQGQNYVRFLIWNQFWLTSQNLENPDLDLRATPSLRRSRFLVYAQLTDRFLVLAHWGLNNLSAAQLSPLGNSSDPPQLFLHDAWTELRVLDQLYLGGGLHYWRGFTRMSSASTLNFMSLDQSRPFVSWPSLGITDQFVRHMGVYAKGRVGAFDYRVAINSPMRSPIDGGADYATVPTNWRYNGMNIIDTLGNNMASYLTEGYFRFSFWDREDTKLPFAVGTYLGQKKVLTVGVGFFSHPDAMYDPTTQRHDDVLHLAADAYLDLPLLQGKAALNVYAAAMRFDFAEGYVGRWAGTGDALHLQLGWLWAPWRVMPYLVYQRGDFEGMEKPITALDLGINYFIQGHNAKLTLEYHRIQGDTREPAIATQDDALAQIRLQLHLFL